MKLDSKDIDKAVKAAIAGAKGGKFSLADVFKHLEIKPENLEAEEIRLERELEADESLFKYSDSDQYILRSSFFEGKQFIITPSELEIDNNILFPGHRFCAFCHEDIFPSEVTLFESDSETELATKEFTYEVTELMPYHILLGSEQIFDFFIAENTANKALLDDNTNKHEAIVNVFKMENFYSEHKFSIGDALLVTVEDWENGEFSFEYISGSERKNNKVKEWINDFGGAVEMVIDRFEAYLEIPDQLRWAFFMGDSQIWNKQAGSLDEFYAQSDRVEINFSNASHTILARKISAQSTEEFEIPENIGISSGKINSLQELLEDINSPLKAVEIDSYILSQCHQTAQDFDSFFRRCFGVEKLSFADDAQEVIFINYLEDRWETLFNQYNPVDDELKAKIREQILECIDDRLELFHNLSALEISPDNLPEENMKKLAEVSLYFTELLQVLNSESHTLKEEDREELAEAVARMRYTQSEEIEKIHQYLKI